MEKRYKIQHKIKKYGGGGIEPIKKQGSVGILNTDTPIPTDAEIAGGTNYKLASSGAGKNTNNFNYGAAAGLGLNGIGAGVSKLEKENGAHVGSQVLGGAGTGASIGALFGPWGPAVGAVVGAGIGLAGGLKDKKDLEHAEWSPADILHNSSVYRPTFPNGGMMNGKPMQMMNGMPNAQIEKNEVVQSPDGQMATADAPSHENGGVNVNLQQGDKIFSDRLKSYKGVTFAKEADRLKRQKEKFEKSVIDGKGTQIALNTSTRMIKNIDMQLDSLFNEQETIKAERTKNFLNRKMKSGDLSVNNDGAIEGNANMDGELEQYKGGGRFPSKSKAKEILHDKTAQGHPLTDKQRRFFGWLAYGKKPDGDAIGGAMGGALEMPAFDEQQPIDMGDGTFRIPDGSIIPQEQLVDNEENSMNEYNNGGSFELPGDSSVVNKKSLMDEQNQDLMKNPTGYKFNSGTPVSQDQLQKINMYNQYWKQKGRDDKVVAISDTIPKFDGGGWMKTMYNISPFVAPAVNIARGLTEKPFQMDANKYMVNDKVEPTKMDINPQLRQAEGQRSVMNRNIRRMGPQATLSGQTAYSNWLASKIAQLYNTKQQFDASQQNYADRFNIGTQTRNKQTQLSLDQFNEQNKAAKRNMLWNAGAGQLPKAIQDTYVQRETLKNIGSMFDNLWLNPATNK